MNFIFIRNSLLIGINLFCSTVNGQIKDSTEAVQKEENIKYPILQIKGLFQARYLVGVSKGIDVNGLHHSDGSGTDNNFMLKYMRVQARAQISKRTEVVVLANLADFKNDPKSRVLENAYLKYTFNPKLAFTVGQFRPWFGIEETYPIDIIKSLDWSNQYTEFGKLGWTSFQIGISATGQLQLGEIPFQYAISVVNGNGKNQVNDNDNGKQYSTRLVFGLAKKYNLNLGLNGGIGEVFSKKIYGLGIDLSSLVQFDPKWSLDMQLEAKQESLVASRFRNRNRFINYLYGNWWTLDENLRLLLILKNQQICCQHYQEKC